MKELRTWSRAQVAERILEGDVMLIYDGLLLQVSKIWLGRHPGGALAILHFVGRDATDEINGFHSEQAKHRMKSFVVGKVEIDSKKGWEPLVPPVMSGWVKSDDGRWLRYAKPITPKGPNTQQSPPSQILLTRPDTSQVSKSTSPTLRDLQPQPSTLVASVQHKQTLAYKKLHQQVIDQGLYQTPYVSGYGPELLRYILLAFGAAVAYRYRWFKTSAVFLGALWHQLAFTAHDLGHNGVTHGWATDRILGIFIADFLGGLSIGWWVDNHNIHHLVTNHPSHDPDIQHTPFFAISPHFAKSLWSSYYNRLMTFDLIARILIPIQHILFYIIMSLGRFNLYVQSYSFLAKRTLEPPQARGGKWVWGCEVLAIFLFWTWYTRLLIGCGSWQKALPYFLISNIVPSPLHVQIVLSHFSRSTTDYGPAESFFHRQLRTTADVICPDYLAFLHGGLHLQVTHHLFPRLPRHNLKKASLLVKKFAAEEGLEYAEFGFLEGNKEVRGLLRDVAHQVAIVKTVADGMTRHD